MATAWRGPVTGLTDDFLSFWAGGNIPEDFPNSHKDVRSEVANNSALDPKLTRVLTVEGASSRNVCSQVNAYIITKMKSVFSKTTL